MLIRELRFGKPKSGKTKNVVESYPKPMLVINTEMDGLSSVRGVDVKEVSQVDLLSLLPSKPDALPAVTVVNALIGSSRKISLTTKPEYTEKPFQLIGTVINNLYDKGCPFQSIVFDSLSGLSEAAINLVGKLDEKLMADPRKWAGVAGAKAQEVLNGLFALKCPVVVMLAHEQTSTNEKTNDTTTTPMVVGSLKERIGALASQVFYSEVTTDSAGKPKYIVRVRPIGNVKGIGARSDFTTDTILARFQDIYPGWQA
jgi:hypothetical protein